MLLKTHKNILRFFEHSKIIHWSFEPLKWFIDSKLRISIWVFKLPFESLHFSLFEFLFVRLTGLQEGNAKPGKEVKDISQIVYLKYLKSHQLKLLNLSEECDCWVNLRVSKLNFCRLVNAFGWNSLDSANRIVLLRWLTCESHCKS